jgi:N-acetyl-gamma-glutamylphosphate reductase
MKTRVGIIGATGYTGVELLRLLLHHPEVEVTALTSQKYAGLPVDQVFPSVMKYLPLKCEELNLEQVSKRPISSLQRFLTRRRWRQSHCSFRKGKGG